MVPAERRRSSPVRVVSVKQLAAACFPETYTFPRYDVSEQAALGSLPLVTNGNANLQAQTARTTAAVSARMT
jgi:hypothetical protein